MMLVHKEKQMKAYKPTRELVNSLLDGNPLGNIFLVTALEQHADAVIKYSAWLKKNDMKVKEIVNPHALARTAEEVKVLMDKHFK